MKISLLVCVGCLLFAVVFLQTRRPGGSVPKESTVEMSARDLTRRDNCWFLANGSDLFTGWLVASYTNDSLQARSAIVRGKQNGISEGWYRNGQLQIREFFRDNVAHGKRQKWYSNGVLMSEAVVAQGRIEGIFQRWFENGQLAERIEMRKGRPDGLALAYYPSGFLQARTRAADGKVLQQETWADGEYREPSANPPRLEKKHRKALLTAGRTE